MQMWRHQNAMCGHAFILHQWVSYNSNEFLWKFRPLIIFFFCSFFGSLFVCGSLLNLSWNFIYLFILWYQESHIHSLMNVLRYCNLDDSLLGEDSLVCDNALDRLYKTKELDYMSYIVLRMFESTEVGTFLDVSLCSMYWKFYTFDAFKDWIWIKLVGRSMLC